MNHASITNNDADVAFRTIFIPKLRYLLQVGSLDETDLISLQQVYEPHVISKLGYNRKWPKEYKYGSHEIGSIDLPNLYLEQTLSQISIVQRMYKHDKHSILIHNIFSTFQLQAGLQGDIFTKPQCIRYTDSVWVQSLVNAMTKFKITIHRPTQFKIYHHRVNDVCIMNVACSKKLSTRILRQINNCRQYLRIITLSDITEQDGHTLIPQALDHTPILSKFQWPTIIFPSEQAWKIWDTFIIQTFCSSRSSRQLQFQYRQKQWLIPNKMIHKV